MSEPEEAYDASDAAQVKRARRGAQIGRRHDSEDLLWILSDRRGRRFLWRLLDRCGVFRTSFTGNSTTFFNEGMRNVGLIILSGIMAADPAATLAMIQENRSSDV